jgi:hypothetical protein
VPSLTEAGQSRVRIFISFVACGLHVTLRLRLRDLAPGLTARAVLEKFAAVQMIDVHLPTDDGRTIKLSRYIQPKKDLQRLLEALRLELPAQLPPRITGLALERRRQDGCYKPTLRLQSAFGPDRVGWSCNQPAEDHAITLQMEYKHSQVEGCLSFH